MSGPRRLWLELAQMVHLPSVTIDLMLRETKDNDPFYEQMVRKFYRETRTRHRRFPLVRHWQYGVALCELPASFDDYFRAIESAARRNYKKSERLGYRFGRIAHNDHLRGMREIHQSAEVRQGRMPDEILRREVKPCNDPKSRTNVHDYPYFGVLKGDKLCAYSGCLVCGEAFMIEQLYGHAAYHADGVVPMLLIGMARYMKEHYPRVKYYANEMYFGASPTMRRFKRKFLFLPHRVRWVLGERTEDGRRTTEGSAKRQTGVVG